MPPLFGSVDSPYTGRYNSAQGQGLFLLISNLFKLISVVAGLYFVFQMIMAGYLYLSAEGDAKKVLAAQTKVWQSAVGLVIIAAAFILAAIAEKFTGLKILNPILYGPQ